MAADIHASVEEQLQDLAEEDILQADTMKVDDWAQVLGEEGSYLCMDNSFLLVVLELQAGASAYKGLDRMVLRKSHCHGHGLQAISYYSLYLTLFNLRRLSRSRLWRLLSFLLPEILEAA